MNFTDCNFSLYFKWYAIETIWQTGGTTGQDSD